MTWLDRLWRWAVGGLIAAGIREWEQGTRALHTARTRAII